MPELGLGLSLPQTIASSGFTPKKLSGLSAWYAADSALTTYPETYINQITVTDAGTTEAIGTYTRSSGGETPFYKTGGGGGIYYQGGNQWNLNADIGEDNIDLYLFTLLTVNGAQIVDETDVLGGAFPLTFTNTTLPTGKNVITIWNDISGNNRNAEEQTGRPLVIQTSVINSKPAIQFNQNYLQMDIGFNFTSDNSIFIVFKPIITNGAFVSQGYGEFISAISDGYTQISSADVVEIVRSNVESYANTPYIFTSINSLQTYKIYLNGNTTGSAFYDEFIGGSTTLSIGSDINGGFAYNGYMSEIIIYSRALSAAERQKVEEYLSNKYAIYFPVTIFNNTFNSTVNAQNTTWTLGPFREITTAPSGCPNANCLHLLQGVGTPQSTASVYSNQAFGKLGMLDLTESHTIECWFYVTNIDQNIGSFGVMGRFLLLRSDGGDPLSINFMGDRSIVVGINNPEDYYESQTNISIFNLNSWNHFALVSNRSSGKTTTYINGINRAEMNYVMNTNGAGDGAHWEFSKTHGDDGNPYDIYISNMRWTQKVLYTSNFTPTFTNFPNAQL